MWRQKASPNAVINGALGMFWRILHTYVLCLLAQSIHHIHICSGKETIDITLSLMLGNLNSLMYLWNKCEMLWRNREQVSRQMFLIFHTVLYDQYRPYMHSTRHWDQTEHYSSITKHTVYSRSAFMCDSFDFIQGKPQLLKGSIDRNALIVWDESLHC